MGRNLCRANTDPAGVLMIHHVTQAVGIGMWLTASTQLFGLWPTLLVFGLAVTIISSTIEANR